MTDDPIKAALREAAVAAYEAAIVRVEWGVNPDVENSETVAAAAVAAFLRAPGVLRAISEDGIDAVADDVERAAREAGDD